jgi:hypothetical protein
MCAPLGLMPSCDQISTVRINCYAYQIPLNPPLKKGDLGLLVFELPFVKGGDLSSPGLAKSRIRVSLQQLLKLPL